MMLSDTHFRSWLALLSLASKMDGVIPNDSEMLARTLRKPRQKAVDAVQVLLSARLLDLVEGVGYLPHNWDTKQFKSDNSTARVQKYRAERSALGLPILADYSQFRPTLIERDGERCVYCLSAENLVVDHITPSCLGGTDDIRNLGLACRSCNSLKARKTPEQANMAIRVTTCLSAYSEYAVTVTVTGQRQKQRHRQKEKNTARMARFDEFWDACPKKTARGAAEKAWLKALDLADETTLIQAMQAYADQVSKTEKAYIKTPGPWLNEKRWLDEGIDPAAKPTPEEIEAARDKADQILKRGKYAERYGA